jgi:hypothetical protein
MKNGMVIIDADGHAVDYEPVYRERLPEQYRNRATIYPADNFDRTQNGKLAGKRPPSPAQNLADNAPGGDRSADHLSDRRADAVSGARARLCDRVVPGL